MVYNTKSLLPNFEGAAPPFFPYETNFEMLNFFQKKYSRSPMCITIKPDQTVCYSKYSK